MKLNKKRIKKGIIEIMDSNYPVRIKLKGSKNFNSYWGNIIDIYDNSFVIEYHDHIDQIEFSAVDNFTV